MFPSVATIRIAAYSDSTLWDDRITFWKNVYGYDMSRMIPYVTHAHVFGSYVAVVAKLVQADTMPSHCLF